MNSSKARITFVVYCIIMSLVACQRKMPPRASGNATVPSEKGQSLRGSVDLLGTYVIDLPEEFTVENLDLQSGEFFIWNSRLFIYISVRTASTRQEGEQWRRRAEEEVRQYERNDVFSKNGLDYYGNYTERVEVVSDDHGFNAYVFKGNSELYMSFSFKDDSSLVTARRIWKSSR